MKGVVFRNDTKLFFRNDIRETIVEVCRGQKVMFVYGGGSVRRNGCHADVVQTLTDAGVPYQWIRGRAMWLPTPSWREFLPDSSGISEEAISRYRKKGRVSHFSRNTALKLFGHGVSNVMCSPVMGW